MYVIRRDIQPEKRMVDRGAIHHLASNLERV